MCAGFVQGEVVLGMLKQIGKVRACPSCFKQRGFTESHGLGTIFIPPWDKHFVPCVVNFRVNI